MTDSVIENFVFNFEGEHLIGEKVFETAGLGDFLRSRGYEKNALGNFMAEFADADTVAKIQQMSGNEPIKAALLDPNSRAGIVRHKGNASGGSQNGKNNFLIKEITAIKNSDATREAKQTALDNLFDWTRRLAKGKILGSDGKPLGVMGNSEFSDILSDVYRGNGGGDSSQRAYVDPLAVDIYPTLSDSERAIVDRAQSTSRAVQEYWSDPANSKVYENGSGEFNGRGALAQSVLESLHEKGLVSADTYNRMLAELGKGTNSTAATRVMIEAMTEAAATSRTLITGEDAGYARRAVTEWRAAAQASEIAPETAANVPEEVLDTELLKQYRDVTAQMEQEELHKGALRGSVSEYGKGASRAIARSLQTITISRFASARYAGIGLVIAAADTLHDSFKKGLDGDWSDFVIEGTKFGAVTVGTFAGLSIMTGMAAAIGGAVAAEFVVAGAVVVGAAGAVLALGDLIHKLAVDVGLAEAPLKDGVIDNSVQKNLLLLSNIGEKALLNELQGKLGAPILDFYDQIYVADDQDARFPDVVYGDDDKSELVYARNGAFVDTGGEFDEIYHFGYGEAHGGAGQDIVVGKNATVLSAGSVLYPWMNKNADDRGKLNDETIIRNAQKAAEGLPLFEFLPELERSPIAGEELTLLLDGGSDNDIVFAFGGSKATTAGGLGRDWIYNRSNGGIIYGDTPAGTYEKPVLDAQGNPVLNSDGAPKTSPTKVEDSKENADNIWYSANTVVKDAQHHDFLKFYGLTLTGGNAEGGIAGLLGGGGVGAAAGLANFYASLDETGKYDPARTVYFDHLFPWMTYMFRPNGNGGLDMYVTNQFDQLFTAVFGGNASDAYKQRQALDAQGILKGWMKVENFDLVGSFIGYQQASLAGEGSFGMVFKAPNPIADLMTLLQPLLGVYGIALAAQHGGNVLIDQAITLSAAATRFAKGLKWADGADPLVIDLDGDGIETTEIATSQVYFDVDGDLFAERTGWLDGDDGFLVRDLNGNGRIDDVSEMFGGVGRSGFAQLAGLDSDGDGRITRADLLWAELKVWQDYDRDGVTDSGELKTLDQLGIVSLDLGATGIDIHTPQGARLTGVSDVTFEGGAVRRMFDAILASNDTDTRYAGEAGHAVWQPAGTLDLKGFGRIADLSVATANDIGFSALVGSTAAAMTTATLRSRPILQRSHAYPTRSGASGEAFGSRLRA